MGKLELTLPRLHSAKSNARLKAISLARKKGLGEHVSLPQIIVCGDQSCGKSSALEGLTGFPFPRQDGLCTRFATEIVLQEEDSELQINVSIIPHSSREQHERANLLAFRRELRSFDDLPEVIASAGTVMGLKGFCNDQDSPAFGRDVLQIRVSGPTGLHLSVVDLPGIIQVPNEDQTESDVDDVHALVDTYMKSPRSIILAVVQAGNDISNQPVVRKCKKFDPSGERTIGVITKPDLINEGTESRIAQLANNEDTTRLKLGFFLIKNPSPVEVEAIRSSADRETLERRYFGSAPWSQQTLNPDRLGISKLRKFLQELLDRHIEREMPRVRQEMQQLERKTMEQLVRLGDPRKTTGDLRIYLSRLSMKFDGMCSAALQGNYGNVGFFGTSGEHVPPTRLRAVIHAANVSFADEMRLKGEKRKIRSSWGDAWTASEPEDDTATTTDQIIVSEDGFRGWVKQVYMSTRGRELPGDYNHVFLAELFHEQSSRWLPLTVDHLSTVYLCLQRQKLREQISASLEVMKQKADDELDRLWNDETGQPITYNHYYTDNIQKARNESARKALKKAMDDTTNEDYGGRAHISNNGVDIQRLIGLLQNRVVVNMDEQACAEARGALTAYYKVARKTFVDNVCRQVIERHLLRDLGAVFSPEKIAAYSDEELHAVAEEAQDTIEKRERLLLLHASLKDSLVDLSS